MSPNLARRPSSRLSAEMLRDQALAVSGLLVPKIGGPSVKPDQPVVRALVGRETDDGFDFDFDFDFAHDRIMLDTKTPAGAPQGGGFGLTIQLDNGTLVTSCSYRGEDGKSHLEVVRWNLQP